MIKGTVIAPALDVRTNQPVTWPVMLIRRPANESVVGKIEAIERPRPAVPSMTTANERGIKSINPTLKRHPARLPVRIDSGLRRAANGIVAIRPKVRAPQNNDVRYAAVVAPLSLSSNV